MPTFQTPGVFIEEINAFPPSVVPVATAVPAFVGHTERAQHQQQPLTGKPFRIASMLEYEQVFGVGPSPKFRLSLAGPNSEPADVTMGQQGLVLTQADGPAGGRYSLYWHMRMFFANGGGACYVVSVGNYTQALSADTLIEGIQALQHEQAPAMLVVPEAVLLPFDACTRVQQAMLTHCGVDMQNRMAVLDVWGGDNARDAGSGDPVARFRQTLPVDQADTGRRYGAAYYPWLHTSAVSLHELGVEHIDTSEVPALGQALNPMDPLTNDIMAAALKRINLLAPSAAMAGVWAQVDNTRGVWKAPANVGLNQVVAPAVALSDTDQADLNAPPDGKAINAIRAFTGKGVRVWGARTLDANSADWRYINVRRTLIMVEQSLKLAGQAWVFEPNDANTWIKVKHQAENFLNQLWREGALVGNKPEQAYRVMVGLDITMTVQDVRDGILRMTVALAMLRPAEFILVSVTQTVQKP
jgi:uncharacterized protein